MTRHLIPAAREGACPVCRHGCGCDPVEPGCGHYHCPGYDPSLRLTCPDSGWRAAHARDAQHARRHRYDTEEVAS